MGDVLGGMVASKGVGTREYGACMVGQNETIENKAVYMCNIEENCFSIKKMRLRKNLKTSQKSDSKKNKMEKQSKNKKGQPSLA